MSMPLIAKACRGGPTDRTSLPVGGAPKIRPMANQIYQRVLASKLQWVKANNAKKKKKKSKAVFRHEAVAYNQRQPGLSQDDVSSD